MRFLIAFDELNKAINEQLEKRFGIIRNKFALIVKQRERIADIGFGLGHHRHFEEGQSLAQMMVRAERAERAGR